MRGARAGLGKPREWQVAHYPRLSAEVVRYANKLNRQAPGGLEFTSGEHRYMLCPDTAMRTLEFPATVRCNINGHRMQLGFDVGLCNLLFSDWLPLEDVAALPDDLRKSLIITVLEPVADFFTEHSVGNFSVEDIVCRSTHPAHPSLYFNLSLPNGVIIGQIFIGADEQTIKTLDKIWQATTKPTSLAYTEELPMWVEVAVAGIRLDLDEFRQLSKDDIILLNRTFLSLNEVYARIGDTICFSSVIDGNKLIIQEQGGGAMAIDEQPPADREIEDQEAIDQQADTLDIEQTSLSADTATDEPHSGEPLSGDTATDEPPPAVSDYLDNRNAPDSLQTMPTLNELGDLPVDLLFVVDRIKTTVKEVEHIKPGYVLELNRKPLGEVEIRANGALVGRGELVQIENRAGVRVLKLHTKKKAEE